MTVLRPSRRALRIALATSATLLSVTALGIAVPAAPALAADTATINGATTYQTMAGFGLSEAFGQASAVMNASSSAQQQVFSDLFSTTSGPAWTSSATGSAPVGATRSSRTTPAAPMRPRATSRWPPSARTRGSCGSISRPRPSTG